MLKYLVILLDNTSIAYCHPNNPLTQRKLMPLDVLKKAIVFGMKENLMIQYVLPIEQLPEEYYPVMESIDNIKIGEDVGIYQNIPAVVDCNRIVLRIPFQLFIEGIEQIASLMLRTERISILFTNIAEFKDDFIIDYSNALRTLIPLVVRSYENSSGNFASLNILSDRLKYNEMNNCGAGVDNITIAPNGKFYICPAFYYDEMMGVDNKLNHMSPSSSFAVGDINSGVLIPNPQLYHLKSAPLCRSCDAYHCNRCIWLNQKLTWEVNTPSHQQCVMSHIERNISREIALLLKQNNIANIDIPSINYLDPFYSRNRF